MKQILSRSRNITLVLVFIMAISSVTAFAAPASDWTEPSAFTNPFADVNESVWYYSDVAFVVSNGLIGGVSASEFAPDSHMTWEMLTATNLITEEIGVGVHTPDAEVSREQMALAIYNYARHTGIAPQGAWAIHTDFADLAAVSDNAAEAMMYCVMKNIINGRPGKLLDPQGAVTRAEASAMLHRFAAVAPDSGQDAAYAQTASGSVRGVAENGISVYKGIPYAAPPVGDLRFAPPQDVKPWTDTLDCTEFGDAAVQDTAPAGMTMSEDCLTLNIWTPAQTGDEVLPVYVWIHGGGFAIGAGGETDYNGMNFAKEGIVTVTINYRLNALGYFASQETFNTYGTTGNWAMLDQIKALEWIQENIAAFGGDPKNITVGGESAGSYSVSALISSPLADGLFRRAIMESGSVLGVPSNNFYGKGNLERTIELHRMMSDIFGAEDNAAGLVKMRQADAHVLAKLTPLLSDFTITPAFMMLPVFDGYVLPADVYSALQNGEFNKVSLLWGYNGDEGSIFIPGDSDEAAYRMMAARMFGSDKAQSVLERFPVNASHDSGERLREVFAFSMFSAVMKPYGDALAEAGQNVYAYRFNYETEENAEAGLGAHHGSEIAYAFGNLPASASARQRELSEEMLTLWANFIKTGNPNTGKETPSGVEWPAYDAEDNRMLILDSEVTTAEMPVKEDMEFMEDIMFGSGAAHLK